jgi:hypothetical protein
MDSMDLEPASPTPISDDPMTARADGKVYCCHTLGWVAPDVAFDHHWDTSRPPDDYLSDRASSWDGIKPGE